MKKATFALFTILLVIMWASPLVYGKIPRSERTALEILFDTAGSKNWKKEEEKKKNRWKFSSPGTENKWHGITCDEKNSTVLGITLRGNKLEGEVPANLGNLKNLETLVLSRNKLTDVHEYVGNLPKLTTLDLSNNKLSGKIPPWIKNLRKLKKLDLSNNQFTGGIPSWLGNLENLQELRLDGNSLNGPIPKELGNLSNLTVLRLGHNKLSGEIPSVILKLTGLEDNKSNFKWNALYTNNKSLRNFLREKQYGKDWESTQTIPPKGITAVSKSKNSIEIRWKSIAYTEDSGEYRIFYSTTKGRPYEHGPVKIDDKSKKCGDVSGLKPSTRYYFVIQTWTDDHNSNRNEVFSEISEVVDATTQGITISGYVRTSDRQGVPGVKLTASNKGGSAVTRSDGKYILPLTHGWSGTVTASHKGYTFIKDEQERKYSVVSNDLFNVDYTATSIAEISGKVTDLDKGVVGVTLTFKDKKKTETKITKEDGSYSHPVKYEWTGTVTPSRKDYTFKPEVLVEEITGKVELNFETTPPKISGKVTDSGGDGIEGVTLTFSNMKKEPKITIENEKGEYSKNVPTNWSGNVKPSKDGYIFYPAKRRYVNIKIEDKDKEDQAKVKIEGDYEAALNRKGFISVTGNYMIPPGKDFKDIYGSKLFPPELKAGYKFYRAFYIWGGFGASSKGGESGPSGRSIKWKQTFLSLGLGYNGNISIKFDYKAEVGVFYLRYKEEMSLMENENDVEPFSESGTTVGVRVGGAAIFKISDHLFTEISVGYLYASDTIDEISKEIKLGGPKVGIALGLRF